VTPERGSTWRRTRHCALAARRTTVLATSARDLAEAVQWGFGQALQIRVIGGGSNLLVADAGSMGCHQDRVWADQRRGVRRTAVLVAEAAPTWQTRRGDWPNRALAAWNGRRTCRHRRRAAVNNAGAFGGDIAHSVVAVTVVNVSGARTRLEPTRCTTGIAPALKRHQMGDAAVESVEPSCSAAKLARLTRASRVSTRSACATSRAS
jgi:hypothetical protein